MSSFYSKLRLTPFDANAELAGFPVSEQTSPGREIREIVTSQEGRLIIHTAIHMSPNVPTALAFEKLFEARIGDAAFNNDMKQYTGFLIRRVVEDMGGELVEKGVKIKRQSRYTRGAIYSL